MLNWYQFKQEVHSRLGIDSINPNTEVQSLINTAIVDGVIDLQGLISGLRVGHVTEYTPSSGRKTLQNGSDFYLPSGLRDTQEFYYKETVLGESCDNTWVGGFALDGFAALPAAEGYYQRTAIRDPLEGIETFGQGPVWFLNTGDTGYGFRVVEQRCTYYPALSQSAGDPLVDPGTPVESGELYYLPTQPNGDWVTAYAPWLFDGSEPLC